MDKIFDQLEGLVEHYEELQELMSDPEVISDTPRYLKISKEAAEMQEIVTAFKKYQQLKSDIAESKEVLTENNDPCLLYTSPSPRDS